VKKFAPHNEFISSEMCKEIADDFNTFFAAVGQNLADAIDSGGRLLVDDEAHTHTTQFSHFAQLQRRT
jgi:hypothetical protein